jgi:predicted chitinase
MSQDLQTQLLTLIPAAHVLLVLLVCAIMGLLGQGIRAVVGLKGVGSFSETSPNQQSEFNAAYLAFSLMIGMLAGILAGLVIGPANFHPEDIKTLLAVATSGYAGADFIESTYSVVFPSASRSAKQPAAGATTNDVKSLTAHVLNLNATVSSLATAVASRGMAQGHDLAPAAAAIPGLGNALTAVAPHINASVWLPALSAAFTKYSMLTNKRMAAAIGQFLVEAGSSFQEVVENLRYTSATRIAAVFPREFASAAEAQPYVNNPVAFANRVYANRLGNGDEASGDGYRFCGRGLIQLTGRNEYTQFGATLGMTPEQTSSYLETPEGAAMSGCWYLSENGCLPLADTWDISSITRRVNGTGMEGAAQRLSYSNAVLQRLGG